MASVQALKISGYKPSINEGCGWFPCLSDRVCRIPRPKRYFSTSCFQPIILTKICTNATLAYIICTYIINYIQIPTVYIYMGPCMYGWNQETKNLNTSTDSQRLSLWISLPIFLFLKHPRNSTKVGCDCTSSTGYSTTAAVFSANHNVNKKTLKVKLWQCVSVACRDRNSSDFFVLHEFWLNLYPFLITTILDWHFSMPLQALKHEVLKWSKKSFTLHRDRLHWITQLQRGTWHAFDIVVLTTHRSIQIFKALTGRTWGLDSDKMVACKVMFSSEYNEMVIQIYIYNYIICIWYM